MSAVNESIDSVGLRALKVGLSDDLAAKDRHDLALATNQEGVWDWDLRTNEVYFSESLYRMLGFDPVSAPDSPLSWTHLVHPEDRVGTLRAINAHLIGRTERYRIDHRIRHRDGTYRWIAARGCALRDGSDHPLRLIGMSTDVTNQKKTEFILEERQRLLRVAVESSLDAFLILRAIRDHDGRVEYFEIVESNVRARELLDIPLGQLCSSNLFELVKSPLIRQRWTTYTLATYSQKPRVEEFDYQDTEGRTIWIFEQIVPIQGGIALTISDVTERRAAEKTLKENEARIQRITQSVPELIYIFDIASRQVVYRNRSLMAALGYQGSEYPFLDYDSLARVVFSEDLPSFLNHFLVTSNSVDDETYEVQLRLVKQDGNIQWRTISTVVFTRDQEGRPTQLLGSSVDITERKLAEVAMQKYMQELEEAHSQLAERQAELQRLNRLLGELATQDGLTSLFNHRALHEHLNQEASRAMRHGEPLSFIMADLDEFKAYNDQFGHPAGDLRLCEFAQVLRQEVRAEDVAARYGGEEFAIILPRTTLEEAVTIAERIRKRLDLNSEEHRFTASFGCAQLAADALDPDQLVKDADTALYQAKRDGKNCIRTADYRETDGGA